MSEQFTPGPWETDGIQVPTLGQAVRGGAYTVCYVQTPIDGHVAQHGERQANANLIASAPDLYEALKYAREKLGNPVPIGRRGVARKIDAALALARGEQSVLGRAG